MKKETKVGILGAYVYELLIAAALIPLFAFLASLILARLSDPMGAVGAAALASLLLSAVSAGMISPRIRKEGWVMTSLAASVTLSAVIAVIGALLTDGGSLGRSILSSVIYVAVFMLTALFSQKKKPKRRKAHYKR